MSAIPSKNKFLCRFLCRFCHPYITLRCLDVLIWRFCCTHIYIYTYIYTYGHQHDHLTPCCACARDNNVLPQPGYSAMARRQSNLFHYWVGEPEAQMAAPESSNAEQEVSDALPQQKKAPHENDLVQRE